MPTPDLDWRNADLGTRVRVALWLRDEIGEGGTFSKAALRAAISGAEQVDRRMRDLRPHGLGHQDEPGYAEPATGSAVSGDDRAARLGAGAPGCWSSSDQCEDAALCL